MTQEFCNNIQKTYLKLYTKGTAPLGYLEDSLDSGVLYLVKDASVFDTPAYKKLKPSVVSFSTSHSLHINLLYKILAIYQIKKVCFLADTIIEFDVPDMINHISSIYDKHKQNLLGYVSSNARRYLFLLKKTSKKKYLKALKKEKFLLPVKINANNEFESLITSEKVLTSKTINNEKETKEIVKDLLIVFTDTYSYDIYKSKIKNELNDFSLILISYSEIKKHILKHHTSGLYINNQDDGIFGKNLNYILPIRPQANLSISD